MNVHFSYRISKTADLEKQVKHQLEKLNKYLQVFRPELIHIKGIVEESSAREGFVVSLNLRLPSGQMAAQEKSPVAATAIKAAFDALTEQLKRHKQVLRSKHKWMRHRTTDRRAAEIASFENTVAVVRPAAVSSVDIASYIDVSLPRLEGFVERQIAYRESLGELSPDQVAPEDVVAEAIATALSDELEKPERIKIEPWLYRLASEAIDRIAAGDGSPGDVPLERSARYAQRSGQRRSAPAISSARRPADGRRYDCRRACRQSRTDGFPPGADHAGATGTARCRPH